MIDEHYKYSAEKFKLIGMKIISWNCQGAFRTKGEQIMALNPDILLVQECERLEKLKLSSAFQQARDMHWIGDSSAKGIAIFSYSDWTIEPLQAGTPAFRYVIPYRLSREGRSIILLAIWAMNDKKNPAARYIGQVWLAAKQFESMFGESTILMGDFNSNKIWDSKSRVGNHSDVVEILAAKKIVSVYHKFFNEQHGEEQRPTFFLQRNKNKSYHIDYCFVSSNLAEKLKLVEVGSYDRWVPFSDHAPLSVVLDR